MERLRLCCRCFSTLSSMHKLSWLHPVTGSNYRLMPLLLPSRTNVHLSQVIAKSSPAFPVLVRKFASVEDTNKPQESKKIPFFLRVLIVSCIGGFLAYYVIYEGEEAKKRENEVVRYKELEKAKLGGGWTLTNHFGVRQSSTDFLGKWVLTYFGFTHCPDICPEELEKLSKVVKNFEENPAMPKMQPIFITLDPERDTPSVIKDYCEDFKTPRLIGFTGTEEEIREVAKKFRVYHSKGQRDADNDYIVDHTIIIYLVNPEGQTTNFFDRTVSAEKITKSIINHINLYNQIKH